jgi:hypothetical protein
MRFSLATVIVVGISEATISYIKDKEQYFIVLNVKF